MSTNQITHLDEIAQMVYDKLMDNTNNSMFNPVQADNPSIDCDSNQITCIYEGLPIKITIKCDFK